MVDPDMGASVGAITSCGGVDAAKGKLHADNNEIEINIMKAGAVKLLCISVLLVAMRMLGTYNSLSCIRCIYGPLL